MLHFIQHLKVVNKHRFLVFLHMTRMGFFFQGLRHDLSKYLPSEFIPSAKYYLGDKTPVYAQRKANEVYSQIAITHTKRNKHHFEYWIDIYKDNVVLIMMPYKYACEYVADIIAASKTYNKKNFTRELPLSYFISHSKNSPMHLATKEFVISLLQSYLESGFKNLSKKKTKKLYNEIKNKHKFSEIHQIDIKKDLDIKL